MRIALHHPDPLQAGRLAELLRFAGLEVTVVAGLAHALAAPAGAFQLLAAPLAALRSDAPDAEETVVRAGPYELRSQTREAFLHGAPVHLTAREFDLALHLFRNVGRRLTRPEIAAHVWGRVPPESRTIDAHVSSLRRKLSLRPANGLRLAAHYGHGYCLTAVSAR